MILKNCKKNKWTSPEKLNNEKGAALIISTFVLTVLFGLTACFSLASVVELKESERYVDSTEAFWAAEAAINRFIQNTAMLDDSDQTLQFGESYVFLSKDDASDPANRIVTATATANGVERELEVRFPAGVASIWSNTASTGGNLQYNTLGATSLDIDGLTRISGIYDEGGFGWADDDIDDLEENVDSSLTTLTYPDVDGNDTADEFNDFREYYQHMTNPDDPDYTGEYTADEVLYLPSDATFNFLPEADLNGKKVIFIDGGAPGEGHAAIHFDSSWAADQNITVAATGTVVFVQPLNDPVDNSKLNTVSWTNYLELSAFDSDHRGTNYAHDEARVIYGGLNSSSTTHGSVIANDGITVGLLGIGATKTFTFEDPLDSEGAVPPGFQGLVSGGGSGFSSTPSTWSEI